MQVADVEMVRAVRREMSRHQIDSGETQVYVSHGIVHLNGRVKPIRGHENEFDEEIHTLHRVLKQRPGIREVLFEWTVVK